MAIQLIRVLSLLGATLALAGPCAAEPDDTWRLTPGAFGTLSATHHGEDAIEYRRDISQAHGARADQFGLETDSLLGVQLNIGYGPRLEAVVQAISKLDPDNGWEPRLSRGFLRYLPDEALMLRAGRIPLGVYLRVESRDVAYSYLTIRPPVEAYGYLANDTVDGLDLQLTQARGPALWRLKLFAGHTTPVLATTAGRQQTPRLLLGGVILDLLYEGWQFRLGAGQARAGDPVASPPVVEPLRATGEPQAVALADRLAATSDRFQQLAAAVAYDQGPVQFELLLQSTSSNHSFGQNSHSGHALLGYQVGKLTPFVSFAMIDSVGELRETGLSDPAYAGLNQAARAVQVQGGLVSDQRSLSLGLRYDFAPHFDLKFQVDRVAIDNSQLIFDRRADPRPNIEMTVFGLALDFAF